MERNVGWKISGRFVVTVVTVQKWIGNPKMKTCRSLQLSQQKEVLSSVNLESD